MLRIVTTIFAAAVLSGCAAGNLSTVLGDLGADPASALAKAKDVEDVVLGAVVMPLPVYCKAPLVARALLRSRINARPEAEGATIAVHCVGDPALTLGP